METSLVNWKGVMGGNNSQWQHSDFMTLSLNKEPFCLGFFVDFLSRDRTFEISIHMKKIYSRSGERTKKR